jgi:threonine dehydrogenase-like Zn-dependent dehydrogenase
VVPATAVTVVPDDVPAERAILAGTVETALNAVWDAAPMVGDRIAVVGAGMVGASVAKVLAGFPAAQVQLVDSDPAKASVAEALGVPFATPHEAVGGCDMVIHASATEAGLVKSLELLAEDGEVIELSWYGERRVTLPLARRDRRSYGDRMAIAMRLLADPGFEALVTREFPFGELPAVMSGLATGELPGLCIRIRYDGR